MKLNRSDVFRSLVVCSLLAFVSTASAQQLTFTVSSPMVKLGCAGDTDGDCLDNALEQELAEQVAPLYFYDEDESCSGLQAARFARQDFYQVRPSTPALSHWTDANYVKHLNITYFLLHPRDCQNWVVTGGHQGDSEKVEYHLTSRDLRTWTLSHARYWNHGNTWTFWGSRLAQISQSIGVNAPIVAADEDGHGSWPGRSADSEDCADEEDDWYHDCFNGGSLRGAYEKGRWERVKVTRNIGGPAPERWNPQVLNVGKYDDIATSSQNVGFGTNVEHWDDNSGINGRFCGWQCTTRQQNGHCAFPADGDTECSDGLSTKVDKTEWPLLPLSADYTPDNSLLRDSTTGAIYVIQGGAKHWIPKMDWFHRLGLHVSRVRDVPSAELAKLPEGAARDGTLLTDPTTGAVYVMAGGAKLHVANPQQFAALGYDWANVRKVPTQALAAIPEVPRDGTLVHDRLTGKVYVMHGGAKLHVANPDQFTALGYDWANVRTVPETALALMPDVPRDGTLYRTEADPRVYAVFQGARFLVPDDGYLTRVGWNAASLRTVPSTAMALPHLPIGHVDVYGTHGSGVVAGWAFDPDVPAEPIGIHIYVDGPAGVGTLLASTTTSVMRGDVNAHYWAYGLTGTHGFEVPLPLSLRDGKPHTLYVYALDAQGRWNPWLDATAYTFTWIPY